jgi:tRNA modification GTPase
MSLLHHQGLEALRELLAGWLQWGKSLSKEEIVITSSRHYRALTEAASALGALITSLRSGVSAEFAAADMRAALVALGSILGSDVTEEILSEIFSTVCVGK